MFSGIIEELGVVTGISRRGAVSLLEIKAELVRRDTGIGDSIAVNGVCLTVIKNERGILGFEVIPETLRKTNLGSLAVRDTVNLERSLKVGDRISGHFVTGHIDCVGVIRKTVPVAGNRSFEIAVDAGIAHYILPKGSVAVDGISLTVAQKRANTFSVYLIPHTQKATTLRLKGPSDKVNIECDILLKRPRA